MKKTGPSHRQRMPIPSDWDGESWQCYQISWPHSQEWLALLYGILQNLFRGWFWNEQTGTVTEAQAVGRTIYQRNFPLMNCFELPPDSGGDGETIITGAGGAGGSLWEYMNTMISHVEFDQTACVIKFYSGMCCVLEVDLGSCLGITGNDADPGITDPSDPPEDDIACRKAWYMAFQTVTMVETGWNNFPNDPYTWISQMQGTFSGLQLSFWKLLELYGKIALVWSVGEAFINFWSDVDTQTLSCLFYPHLNDIDFTLSDDEYKACKDAAKNHGNFVMSDIIQVCMDAIGKGDYEKIVASSRTIGTYYCVCPEPEIPEDIITGGENGWYLGTPTTIVWQATGGFSYDNATDFKIPDSDVFGVMFEVTYLGGDPINRLKRANSCSLSPTFCHVLSNSDTHSVNTQYLQMANQAYADLSGNFASPVQINEVGKVSDDYNSPVCTPAQSMEFVYAAQAQGNEGEAYCTVQIEIRYLHNTNALNP